MESHMDALTGSQRWNLLARAAKQGAVEAGFALKRVPGRGLSNIWDITKNGKTRRASIRTTRDRWIAYQPMNNGQGWKTLDDVETVIVAAVDSAGSPQNVEVYIFPAEKVRKRFNDAYTARLKDGQTNKDNFGMWVGLDKDERGIAASVGSGITDHYKPVATFSIKDLIASMPEPPTEADAEAEDAVAVEAAIGSELTTISDVMEWARARVAQIAGVGVAAVRLELKVEY